MPICQSTKQLWTLHRSMIVQSQSVHRPLFCQRIWCRNTTLFRNSSRAARTPKKWRMVTIIMVMFMEINCSQRELLMRIRSRTSWVHLLQEVASHHASPKQLTSTNNWSRKSTTQRPKQPTIANTATMVVIINTEPGKCWLRNKKAQLPVRWLESRWQGSNSQL